MGRKSIVTEIVIQNQSNPALPYIVRVQANKNHGICDIIVGSKIPQEIVDKKTEKKKTIMKFFFTRRLGEVLSAFQGRQYDDADVFNHLENVLTETLNPSRDEQEIL